MSPTRKLAAIMFTDIVGYTAIMGEDEHKAMRLLEKNREVQKPLIKKHNGTWLKELGDGTLSSFHSAIDAVNCAIEIQRLLKWDPKHNLRIGIHVGDVVFEKGDVFGSGVNVASRIEPLSPSGGICVSERVYDDIRNKPDLETVYLGEKKLKNVDHPVKVYALVVEGLAEPSDIEVTSAIKDLGHEELIPTDKVMPVLKPRKRPSILTPYLFGGLVVIILALIFYPRFIEKESALPVEKQINPKSIAVLPFTSFTKSEGDESFTAGIHDDILTQLAKIGDLKVISRTSVVRYKETQKSMREIAAELSVANILEGSVRRVGDRIRIIAQLVKANTDEHLWAETYDRDYADIFTIQSDIAQKIASALKATLTPKEKNLIEKKPTDNMEAYDFYLRGNDYFHQGIETYSDKELLLASKMYEKAIELDSTFALAYAKLSWTLFEYLDFFSSNDLRARAKKVIDKALQLDPDLPEAHMALGISFYREFDYDQALKEFTFVQERQPGNSDVHEYIGRLNSDQGKWEKGLSYFEKAAELDPRSGNKACVIGGTYLFLRNYPEAIRYHDRAISLVPDRSCPYSCKAVIYLVWEGDTKKAREALDEASQNAGLETNPSIISVHFMLDVFDGEYQNALNKLSLISDEDIFHRVSRIFQTKMLAYAEVYRLMNQPQLQLTYYDSARKHQEANVSESPDDPWHHSLLGLAYAGLDLKEEAVREGEFAVKLPIATKAVYQREYVLWNLAKIYSMVGEYDLAIDKIELALSRPGHISIPLLRADPTWGALRDYPRFQKLIAEG